LRHGVVGEALQCREVPDIDPTGQHPLSGLFDQLGSFLELLKGAALHHVALYGATNVAHHDIGPFLGETNGV
jgi:hypothetical protein